MKNYLPLSIFSLIPTFLIAQNSTWTKSDRNNLFEDCSSIITSDYKNVNSEQKETICLCYLDAITSKFQKENYQSKIDVELKRIKIGTMIQCAKNIAIELSSASPLPKEELIQKPTNNSPSKENLKGHWKDEESEFWLFETGDFKMNYNDGSSSKGTWKLDSDILTLYHDKLIGTKQKDFKILMFNEDKFVYQSLKNKRDTFSVIKLK